MSQYTINVLISILNGIKKDGLTKIDSDENVKLLIENLLAQKIELETKNRKKKIVKLIQYYCTKEDSKSTVGDLIDFLESDDSCDEINNLFSAKSIKLSSEEVANLISDFLDYFILFSPTVKIETVLRNAK